MSKANTDKCNELLDAVFFFDGKFNYELSILRLEEFRKNKTIDLEEYMNYLDALNHRRDDGHYRNSMIYKRAEADNR